MKRLELLAKGNFRHSLYISYFSLALLSSQNLNLSGVRPSALISSEIIAWRKPQFLVVASSGPYAQTNCF